MLDRSIRLLMHLEMVGIDLKQQLLTVPSEAASLAAARTAFLLCASLAAFAALSLSRRCCFARCAAPPLVRFPAVHSSPEDSPSSDAELLLLGAASSSFPA